MVGNKAFGKRLGNVLLAVVLFSQISAMPLPTDVRVQRTQPRVLAFVPNTLHSDRLAESTNRVSAKFLHTAKATASNVLTAAKYRVRWFNPQEMRFGSSVNITFMEPMDFARNWQIRFRFKSEKVVIEQYWGSWSLTRLSFAHWYQLKPTPELRMNADAMVFFNFNAVADNVTAPLPSTDYPMQVAEWEVQMNQGPNRPPLLSQLWESSTGSGGLINTPMAPGLPTAPYGRFAAPSKELKAPVRLAEAFQDQPLQKIVETPSATNRFVYVGMLVVGPILMVFCILCVCATGHSWWWRRNFRRLRRREELKWQMAAKRPPPSRRGSNLEKADASDLVSKQWRELDEGYALAPVTMYVGVQLPLLPGKLGTLEPKKPPPIKTRTSLLHDYDDTPPPWSPSLDGFDSPGTVSSPRTGRKMSAYYHNALSKTSSPPPYASSPLQTPTKAFSPKINSPLASSPLTNVVRRPSPPALTGFGVANVIGSFADAAGLVIREEEEEGVEQEGDIGGGGERWEYGGDLRNYASKKRQLRKMELIQEAQTEAAAQESGSTEDTEEEDEDKPLELLRQDLMQRPQLRDSLDGFEADDLTTDRLSRILQEDASKHQPLADTDSENDTPRQKRASSSASQVVPVKVLPPSKTLAIPSKSCLKAQPAPVKKTVQWDETSFASRSKQKRMKRVTKEEKAARLERKRREAQTKAQQEKEQV